MTVLLFVINIGLNSEIDAAEVKQVKFDKKGLELRKYEQYLEKVRSTYPDQYPEMSDILSRYHTLKKSNKKLFSQKKEMEEEK